MVSQAVKHSSCHVLTATDDLCNTSIPEQHAVLLSTLGEMLPDAPTIEMVLRGTFDFIEEDEDDFVKDVQDFFALSIDFAIDVSSYLDLMGPLLSIYRNNSAFYLTHVTDEKY